MRTAWVSTKPLSASRPPGSLPAYPRPAGPGCSSPSPTGATASTFADLLRPGNDTGGALFYWAYGGTPFTLAHQDLSTYLDQWTSVIELGDFLRERMSDGRERFELGPQQRWLLVAADRLL